MPVIKCEKWLLIKCLAICTVFLGTTLYNGNTHAAQIQWAGNPYSHFAEKADVKDVLTDLLATQGKGIVFSENVSGSISGNFEKQSPERFFNYIISTYNLIWYYDGAAVYIYSANEMTSQVVNLNYVGMAKLEQDLTDLDILDPKYAMRMVAKERILYLSGPPRYVELVSQLALQLDEKAMAQSHKDDIVSIFKLKYAWADDKIIHFRDRDITLPGIATLLKDLLAGIETPGQVLEAKKRALVPHIEKLKGQGLSKKYEPNASQDEQNTKKEDRDKSASEDETVDEQSMAVATNSGFIQADARQNAIVIRDHKEKIPYYQRIIDLLDVPVGLVEIKATIIDVDRNNLQELGIQWEFASKDGNRVTRGGMNTDTDTDGESGGLFSAEDGLQLPTGSGLNLATIIGDATDYFLARVKALEEKGHAKVLSRPSVLTINNTEAQLEHSQTFYVRLAGNYEVDLFDINAGVVLRVTPHIIEEKKRELVKLAIQIEDSDVLEEEVDEIPIVKRSVVNTQAVIGRNESLLIGGYIKERKAKSQDNVPCLGNIPFLGWLFKHQKDNSEQYERLFLITPTIKDYGEINHLAGPVDGIPQVQPDQDANLTITPIIEDHAKDVLSPLQKPEDTGQDAKSAAENHLP